ncbi:unnamed protein product [Lactuca saligna]|uniref:TF-B3 domain-containing protein n=1 Tax=Lactuca saligna TaxID=75948 RepID=A0AA36EDQ7_LACSI|nr:unnamed protein product [Lactuca saligna]
MASSSGSTKLCFNSTCKEALEVPRQGWLCRTGDFADLCDRCSSAFKDGKFCNTYHMNASGWRCCESCGKQIHCGCIVSFHMFILLDAGGIECINCAKSEYILTPNPTWPSAPHFLTGPAERIRDISSKNWRSISGTGPVPWKQAPYLFNSSKLQPELLSNIDKPLSREQLTSCSLTRSIIHDPSERLVNDSWQMTGDRAKATGLQYDGKHNLFQSFFSNELATPVSSLPATFMAQDQKSEKGKASGQFCPPPSVGKCCSSSNTNSPPGTSLESQTYSGKGQGEKRGRHQLLPRYWPRLTDQELQQISGGSNAKITPLFEKVLSASDAGRIGRLVLPKKCAEAYLPPISQPEGYPLVVQDLKGVTPCIQSMQLQAGDTVTFSRLEPEGKLVMGFRKASPSSPSYHVTDVSTHEEPSKGSFGNKSRNPDGTWAEADKIAKRKKGGKMCSNSKHVKPNDEEIVRVNVTLEQVQGLLRPPLSNSSTIVVIEGVEFEDFQEEPIIRSPTNFPTINHASCNKNETENQGLDALANLAIQDGTLTKSPSGTNHKSVFVHHGDEKHLEKEVGDVGQNPNEMMYADILRYNNNQNQNQNQKTGPGQSIEKVSTSQSFKSQNIDLNIQPEREEECSPVSDMGIMMLVQESTHRYIRQQKLPVNGVNS